ncbi:hypothetical protein LIH_00730 [Leptospira interrogans serovar Hardjo-prajitno]|nr:hypothetical protein LIH_00730 [Leptospira interrogans serovar Hardjo-prajitno]
MEKSIFMKRFYQFVLMKTEENSLFNKSYYRLHLVFDFQKIYGKG